MAIVNNTTTAYQLSWSLFSFLHKTLQTDSGWKKKYYRTLQLFSKLKPKISSFDIFYACAKTKLTSQRCHRERHSVTICNCSCNTRSCRCFCEWGNTTCCNPSRPSCCRRARPRDSASVPQSPNRLWFPLRTKAEYIFSLCSWVTFV